MIRTRTWTETGTEHTGTPEARRQVERAIERLQWSVRPGNDIPMIASEALNLLIREFEIPNVSVCAISNELAPYGFYGIEGHYTNGRVRLYVVDTGARLVPVANDLWSTPERAAA